MKNSLLLKEINSLYLKDHFFRVNVLARREREQTTRQSTEYNGHVRTIRFAHWLTVDRHGLRPRDDKEWKEIVVITICHCEEGAETDDAAIHRVSRDADEFVCSLTGSQWIATG